ncbi:MAG: UDP-glucose 4-epimerase GalE [Planctomycetia bacterium]|nr:UDP-glucose 4-epimerase GalE [Planctomycetia bacterium]
MHILVTGGAGYIGSHATKMLVEAGHQVTVVDNLSKGYRDAVHPAADFHLADIADTETIAKILRDRQIEGIMHFAALIEVGESVREPIRYYNNNTGGAIRLLSAAAQAGVKKFVFSSTAAVYGEPDTVPITESNRKSPINPYGTSKWFVERILSDHAAADPDFAYSIFRYFNVAGASTDGSLGERHQPESHLIPIVLQAAMGKRPQITVFGTDYPTPDGTCIRDYIHVEDLCDAHIRVMQQLRAGDRRVYNLGIGHGYSVREVLESAQRVVGHPIPTAIGERRPGDPARLYADSTLAQKELGWTPRHTDLDEIIGTAWNFLRTRP